jgi:hypothetical protein
VLFDVLTTGCLCRTIHGTVTEDAFVWAEENQTGCTPEELCTISLFNAITSLSVRLPSAVLIMPVILPALSMS